MLPANLCLIKSVASGHHRNAAIRSVFFTCLQTGFHAPREAMFRRFFRSHIESRFGLTRSQFAISFVLETTIVTGLGGRGELNTFAKLVRSKVNSVFREVVYDSEDSGLTKN